MNLNKEIHEGWTLGDIITDLEPIITMIMASESWQEPFKTRKELSKWCCNNQPYIRKEIPEVVNYFSNKYKLK